MPGRLPRATRPPIHLGWRSRVGAGQPRRFRPVPNRVAGNVVGVRPHADATVGTTDRDRAGRVATFCGPPLSLYRDTGELKVLDQGEVSQINFVGGDLAVVAAARVSNGVSYAEASKGRDKDKKLINYLMKHRHHTPFEHSVFQFYIKAPLFVVREWHRHRMASYNEISGRYVDLTPTFYIPDRIRVPADTNKQGSVFRPGNPNVDDQHFSGLVREASAEAFRRYEELKSIGVAKELARIVLPLNLYTEFYMTVNARSLMNFLSLRAADDAQWEIRQYAIAMKGMFYKEMPMTYEAFETHGYSG